MSLPEDAAPSLSFPRRALRMTGLVRDRIKRPLGLSILFVSSFLFFSQVFFPALSTTVEAKTIMPVAEGFFEEMALKRIEAFSFDELTFTGGLFDDIAPDEVIPTVFYLTIPRLELYDIAVETNSVDTTPHEMLGHYKGSSLPGKRGNTFIYGHSTLPSHYDPNNYKTLFTYIPRLEAGDEIIITYNNEELKYVVEKKETFTPEDLDPLKWRHLHYGSVSLMTCVPPGTTHNREVVFAKQVF